MAADPDATPQTSVWSWDPESDLILCLPELFALHGRPHPDASPDPRSPLSLSRPRLLELLPPEPRRRLASFLDGILVTGTGGELTYQVAVDNSIRSLRIQAAVGRDGNLGRMLVLGQLRDLTTERMLALSRAQAERELELQQRVLDGLAAREPLSDTLDLICRHLERLYPGAFVAVMLYDPETRSLRSAAAPSLAADFSTAIDTILVNAEGGVRASPITAGRPEVIEDVRLVGTTALVELFDAYGLRSLWSQPLQVVPGHTVGALVLYRSEPHCPPDPEVRVGARLGELAALAVERDGVNRALSLIASEQPETGTTAQTAASEPRRHGSLGEMPRSVEADLKRQQSARRGVSGPPQLQLVRNRD